MKNDNLIMLLQTLSQKEKTTFKRYTNMSSAKRTLNYVILFAKQFIKHKRISKKAIDFYQYQVELKRRILIEEQILKSNGKSDEFIEKWDCLLNCL